MIGLDYMNPGLLDQELDFRSHEVFFLAKQHGWGPRRMRMPYNTKVGGWKEQEDDVPASRCK